MVADGETLLSAGDIATAACKGLILYTPVDTLIRADCFYVLPIAHVVKSVRVMPDFGERDMALWSEEKMCCTSMTGIGERYLKGRLAATRGNLQMNKLRREHIQIWATVPPLGWTASPRFYRQRARYRRAKILASGFSTNDIINHGKDNA